MSGPRDMVRGQQATLIKERAGIPTARVNAQQIAALRAPKAPGVGTKPIITGKLTDGSAAASMLAIGDKQGLWTNQSQRGDDGIASARDDAAVPSNDFNSLSDGTVQVWSDAANSWVPGGPVDTVIPPPLYQDTTDATNPTTATVSYQDGATLTFFLPPGVWTITSNVGFQATRTTAGAINARSNIDGTAGTTQSPLMDATIFTSAWAGQQLAGVSGGRLVSVKVQYKNNSSASLNARQPFVQVICKRTA